MVDFDSRNMNAIGKTITIFSLVPKLHLGTHLLRQLRCRFQGGAGGVSLGNGIALTIAFQMEFGNEGKFAFGFGMPR